MKKYFYYKILMALCAALFGTPILCQELPVWDMPLTEILIAHNKKEFEKQRDIRDNHARSTATLIFTRSQGNTFQQNVAKIHSRLTSIAGLVAAGSVLLEAPAIIRDIKSYEEEGLREAWKAAAFLPVAYASQRQLVERSRKLLRFVELLILTASDINALRQGDRILIAHHLITELRVLRGIAFGFLCEMRMAVQGDGTRRTYPWQDYIEADKKLAKEILDHFKF
ncbi:hypothetical protein V9K67_21750 [Paraflavisolibacter sp. H34]|uniref:hypothetical protein n=1 Tax=Huijunlia imazamoxiresistens TaxID=3127457 RepID=UPI0030177B8C